MKKLLYLGLLSVCVLLGSCVEKNVSNVFDKVERYMDVYPDSALLLLEQIPHPEELRGKQRADYALLLTQARDKNYLDSLQSDLQLGQLERAEMYVRNALSSEDCYTQSGAYHYLYLLEKKRAEYAKALLYKEKSDSLQKIAQEMNLQHKIFEIQQKNEADKLVVENKLLMQEKQIQLYFWLLLSLSFIVVGFVAYQEIKKQYRKSYRKRLKRFMEKELKTYQENEKIIEQYICQIEELKKCNQQAQKGMLSEVLVKEQIGILAQKIQVLKNENKEIREHSQQGALFLLGQLKEGNLNVKKLSEEEWLNIFGYIDLLSGNFVTNLRQKYKLNEHNLMLAVLIKLGFSTAELVAAFVCEENSIFKKKQRLKEKLHLGKQDDLNAFFKTNPLYLSIQKNKL